MKKNRLYRSRRDRMLGGVCSGLANYFEIDPVIVRVLFVIMTIGPGVGLIGYIILWIIVPESPFNFDREKTVDVETEQTGTNEQHFAENVYQEKEYVSSPQKHQGRILVAVILILVGAFWFLDNVFTFVSFSKLWPLILVAVGIIILLKPKTKSQV